MGVNPYPAGANRTKFAGEVSGGFEVLQSTEVTVVGRIVSIRKFGKLAFIVLKDSSGQVQLFIKSGILDDYPNYPNSELSLKELNLLDSGDFIEATGTVIKTQTGEVSVEVKKLRLLTK